MPNMSTNAFGGLWNWSELHFNWTHNYLTALFVRPILQNKLFLKYYMNLDDLGIYIMYLADLFWIKMISNLIDYVYHVDWLHYDIETTYYPIFISSDLIMTITNCVGIAKEWLAIKSLLVTVPNYKHKNYWHT